MSNGLCWTGLARILEKEFDAIMPDARGHGLSSKPDSGYRYKDHADDVVGLTKGSETFLSYPSRAFHGRDDRSYGGKS